MILIIIPTYNEKENVPLLVEAIMKVPVAEIHLLIVDDNSPDGTANVAELLSETYPITILRRQKKEGLGRAYCDAFRYALASFPGAAHIIQMDADLSHDPADIPRMIEAAHHAHLVLASRYVPGGAIKNWHWLRKAVSWLGNVYARFILSLPYRDLTGGFKCWQREALSALDLDNINSLGYNFQIEATYQAHKKGFRIREIPIVFTERRSGRSKFNIKIIFESFFNVFLMRLK